MGIPEPMSKRHAKWYLFAVPVLRDMETGRFLGSLASQPGIPGKFEVIKRLCPKNKTKENLRN